MSDAMVWKADGKGWPHAEFSKQVFAGGVSFHVQVMGEGPVLLLLHGTGASTHSWRGAAALLAKDFTVVMADLPGHGFSEVPSLSRLALPSMAASIAALLKTLKLAPQLAVGHSAGAAILVRMALDGLIKPEAIVSFNGAFFPFGGLAGQLFSPLAKLLVWNPLVPRIFASSASDSSVHRLLADTGSTLDAEGRAFYRRLFANRGHVSGALGMMANWDLSNLAPDMRRLMRPLVLVKAMSDRTVPPGDADRVAAFVPGSRVIALPGLGHLAHEEDPAGAAGIIRDAFAPLQHSSTGLDA
jgi:magnesium chelatase accessory protein